MAVRWGEDIIVHDGGLMLPESELLGVDIVVPDITYLLQNREKVRGIVLTHGHEDHIGALPWMLSELKVPVFGTEFTLALVENKLEEHDLLDDADLREIRAGTRFNLGPFTINPIQVTHSLVDCVALAIHTPMGVVIHTGDFKVDPTPSAAATPRVSARCAASSMKFLPGLRGGCSSRVFHRRSTGSSWPWKWRASTSARSRWWAAR